MSSYVPGKMSPSVSRPTRILERHQRELFRSQDATSLLQPPPFHVSVMCILSLSVQESIGLWQLFSPFFAPFSLCSH